MIMRPLYIAGKTGTRVLWDAPALKVVMPEQANQLFPLARVSRVICTGSVDWNMAAMLACADAGVTLLFMNPEGEARARLLGKNSERQIFLQRLTDLLARADGLDQYQDWLVSMEKLAVRSTARRFHYKDWRGVTAPELKAAFSSLLSPLWSSAIKTLRGLLYSDIIEKLAHCGLDADSEVLQEQKLDLVTDLSSLLFWDFYWPLVCWQNRLDHSPQINELALFYERRSDRIDQLFRGSVNKLHLWLLGEF